MLRRRFVALGFLIALTAPLAAQQADRAFLEQLRALIDAHLAPPAPTELTLMVEPGQSLQAALDAAADATLPVTIVLTAGDHRGNFTLRERPSSVPIVIRAATAVLPAPGTRITPAASGTIPRLVSASGGTVLRTAPGAHHYTIRGIEIAPLTDASQDAIIVDGDPSGGRMADPATQPHHIVFDQVLVRGDATRGLHRGVRLNGADLAVTNSWIDRVWERGRDSQAIAAWSGTGPFRIENNYLEASGENVLFGGAPLHLGATPGGLALRRNDVAKDPDWKTWANPPQVKNLLELKAMVGAVIEDNAFRYNWKHAQTGYAILFTPRSDSGEPSSIIRVEDVVFRRNIVRDVAAAVNVASVSGAVKRLTIEHNLFADIDKAKWGGDGIWIQMATGIEDITIAHNTIVGLSGNKFLSLYLSARGPSIAGLRMHHNVVQERAYGLFAGGGAMGAAALAQLAPGAVFTDNAIHDDPARKITYPSGNFLLPSAAVYAEQFDADFGVRAGSALAALQTSDGARLGADISAH